MDTTTSVATRTYFITAAFASAGDIFATETFVIDVVDGIEPYAIARARASESAYANERVPDLGIAITVVAHDPGDPAPQPPATAAKPICSRCGSDDIVRDASARWDIDTQQWHLSAIYDCDSCGRCEAQSDDLARWVPAMPYSPADTFLWAVVHCLEGGTPAHSAEFQSFCLANLGLLTPAQAAAQWRARVTSVPPAVAQDCNG